MNTIKEIQKINEQELSRGIAGTSASWHSTYAQAAWVYVGNLDASLTEGDVICVLSQFGEIEDIHLVRGEDGKSKGFGFVKYENALSGVLAVDNLIGIQLCGRSLRIDHVENYRLPKNLIEKEKQQQEQAAAAATDTNTHQPGHAYRGQELANEYSLEHGPDLFAPPKSTSRNQDLRGEDDKAARRARKQELRQVREERRIAKEAKRARKQARLERRLEKERRRRARREQQIGQSEQEESYEGYKRRSKKRSVEDHDDKNDNRANNDDGGSSKESSSSSSRNSEEPTKRQGGGASRVEHELSSPARGKKMSRTSRR